MNYDTLVLRAGIEKEIRQLERSIARREGEKAAATSVLSHTPTAPSIDRDKVSRLATDIVYLRGELEKRIRERDEVLTFIESIPDSTLRTAIRLHFVEGFTWLKVGRVLHYDESTIRKKVNTYLERDDYSENSASPVV